MASLYPIDHCKQFLSAVIRSEGAVLAETALIEESDFDETHRPIFAAIKTCVATGPLNRFILISKLQSVGLKIGGEIDPALYINALVDLQGVSDKAAVGIAAEIKKWSVRRNLDGLAARITAITRDPKWNENTASNLVSEVMAVVNERVNLLEGGKDDEPQDLFQMREMVDSQSDFELGSLQSPFPIYNDMYGYFDVGQIYAIIARMKVGKSSFAMSMLQQMAAMKVNEDMRALILDTELSTDEVKCRMLASMSGVKEFYIRHKIYRKYKDMKERVEAALDIMSPLWNRIDHLYIGGWDLPAQLNAAKRWHYKHVRGKSKRGLLALDYFKLNSQADFTNKQGLGIVVGQKVDAYKNLIKKELKIPMIAFGQANREGEDSKAGQRQTNTSVIGGSDMIAQFCSNIYLLERLSIEERVMIGAMTLADATHALKLLAPRQLGPNEMGKDKLVKYPHPLIKGRDLWCENHLLLNFANFVFTEKATFADAMERMRVAGIDVQGKPGATPADGKML